ncbi:TPA: phage head closure protein [Pseudomonas aeruginosa]|nr:phage head closure protein [Pseudomonas aeruginosa]
MSLSAGRLRHRVDIQSKVQTQDPQTGEIIETWVTTWPQVPAEIAPLSVREYIAAQAIQSNISARIVIRYREGMLPTMRILHKGRIYNPAGWLPDPVRGNEYLTAPCSEGVNDG